MKAQANQGGAGRGPRKASARKAPALDYRGEALEALDALLAGPLGGGLGAGELEAQFPVIRAALRQIRSDLDRAWDSPWGPGGGLDGPLAWETE